MKKILCRVRLALRSIREWIISHIFEISILLLIVFSYDRRTEILESFNHSEISFLADIATFFSIVVLIATLKQQKSLFEAQILNEYNKEYMINDSLGYIRTLHDFVDRKHADFGNCRKAHHNRCAIPGFKKNDKFRWTKAEDEARRNVKAYFINALDLYLGGKITKQVFRMIADKSAITALFEIGEPMEWYHNPNYDYKKFYMIMLLIKDIKYKLEIKKDDQNRNGTKINRVSEEEDIKANDSMPKDDSTPKDNSADSTTGKTKPQK